MSLKLLNDEQAEFFKSVVKEHFCEEIRKLINEKYNLNLNISQIRGLKKRLKLKSGVDYKFKRKLLNDEQVEFFKTVVKNRSSAEIMEIINKKYNMNLKISQIKDLKKRLKLKSGVDCRFKKGQVSFNKGKKGIIGMSSTRFKKRQIPYNFKPVGYIRYPKKDHDYVMIKVAAPNIWQQYQMYIWEKYNGKVPKGSVVAFIDGNNRNFALDNLAVVSRAELLELSRLEIKPCKEKILMAKIKCKSNKLKKEMKK